MKSRSQNVSEDLLTISRPNTRSITLSNGRGNSLPISIDLVIEIFLRLPVKSIATCRCVSKLWAAVPSRQDFTELFLTRSSNRPQILYACEDKKRFVFFSSREPRNTVEMSSVAPNHLTHFPSSSEIFGPSNGFVILNGLRTLKGKKNKGLLVSVLFNPSTAQYITLPKMKRNTMIGLQGYECDGIQFKLMNYLGYDPIEKQLKVLSMTLPYGIHDENFLEYQVLTLGARKPLWRIIKCCVPHFSGCKGICIDGNLYYVARINRSFEVYMIACFDFRYEKFSFMKVMETFNRDLPFTTTLINYNGKLGSLISDESNSHYVSRNSTCFELWVLDDAGKREWTKHVYVLPPLWKNLVGEDKLHFVGMIGTNEIVLSPNHQYVPSYVFYYNIERNTTIRVKIKGMEAFEGNRFRTFLNHVENVKLIQPF
ncbi:PREDICTED: putative F-box protein At3g23960 [Camelina sativa]|uniref:F-box protein At3g23960 n=1 Tax=Camelina sativa TaxID=90675 RepID=A0ABM1Q6Z7_CAMSA|nr:PREDICTED: putative F-box protein At3g23960 [Camelina sativa]